MDADWDGWPVCPGVETEFPQDCNDTLASVGPDGAEACDNTDNDCDGEVDEGIPGCPNNPDNPPCPAPG